MTDCAPFYRYCNSGKTGNDLAREMVVASLLGEERREGEMITVIMLCVFFFLLEMNGIFSVCLCAERRSPLLTDGVRTAPGCMMDPRSRWHLRQSFSSLSKSVFSCRQIVGSGKSHHSHEMNCTKVAATDRAFLDGSSGLDEDRKCELDTSRFDLGSSGREGRKITCFFPSLPSALLQQETWG